MRYAAVAAVLAAGILGCGKGDADGTPEVSLEPSQPPGVEAKLHVEHRKATFEEIDRDHPQDSFVGAQVSGNSFKGKSDVYLIRVDVKNGTSKEWRAPHLRLLRSADGEPDVTIAAKARPLPPGSVAGLLYFWDPGEAVARLRIRLEWTP